MQEVAEAPEASNSLASAPAAVITWPLAGSTATVVLPAETSYSESPVVAFSLKSCLLPNGRSANSFPAVGPAPAARLQGRLTVLKLATLSVLATGSAEGAYLWTGCCWRRHVDVARAVDGDAAGHRAASRPWPLRFFVFGELTEVGARRGEDVDQRGRLAG